MNSLTCQLTITKLLLSRCRRSRQSVGSWNASGRKYVSPPPVPPYPLFRWKKKSRTATDTGAAAEEKDHKYLTVIPDEEDENARDTYLEIEDMDEFDDYDDARTAMKERTDRGIYLP